MKRYLYAIYDEQNRVVQIYAEESWARRKLIGRSDWRIETYIHVEQAKEITRYKYL